MTSTMQNEDKINRIIDKTFTLLSLVATVSTFSYSYNIHNQKLELPKTEDIVRGITVGSNSPVKIYIIYNSVKTELPAESKDGTVYAETCIPLCAFPRAKFFIEFEGPVTNNTAILHCSNISPNSVSMLRKSFNNL